jgi:hypothetical protein
MNTSSKKGPLARDPKFPRRVTRLLAALGVEIDRARRRRRIPIDLAAERTGLSRGTWNKILKGSPRVAMGNYMAAMAQVGLLGPFEELVESGFGPEGRVYEDEHLPSRVRVRSSRDASE